MANQEDKGRKVIDQMVKDYVETGRKGGIAIVDEERVRRHVTDVAERAEKKRDGGEYRNRK